MPPKRSRKIKRVGKTRRNTGRTSKPTLRSSRSSLRSAARRSYHSYPAVVEDTGKRSASWLDTLAGAAGTVASKLVGALVGSVGGLVGAQKVVARGSHQIIAVAPDDILINHPLTRTDKGQAGGTFKDWPVRIFPYHQVRFLTLNATVKPSVQASHRGGQICAAFIPFSSEGAQDVFDQMLNSINNSLPMNAFVKTVDRWDYDRISAMPGSRVARADQTLSLSLPLSGWPGLWHRLVDRNLDNDEKAYKQWKGNRGAKPLALFAYGYQDYAASVSNVGNMYSPEEGMFEINLSATLEVRDPGEVILRENTALFANPTDISVTAAVSRHHVAFDVPLRDLEHRDGHVCLSMQHPALIAHEQQYGTVLRLEDMALE